jgi:hypothetical protein
MQPDVPVEARSVDSLRRLMTDLCKALTALAQGVAKAAPDTVRALLVTRAEIVPVIDERLVRVSELLRRGLRDEAIGYAVEPPDLVEAATLLDMATNPNWPHWVSALTREGIPEPVMPRMDLVQGLVKSHDELNVLKPLLTAWRRLNLSNGLLTDRIVMLRKLRQADPTNVVWFETLHEHEKQRLMRVEWDIRNAIGMKDEPRLAEIVLELSEEWIEPVPPRLKAAAAAALETYRSGRIDRQLQEIGASLTSAYEGRDFDAARELRHQWHSLLDEQGALAADDEVLAPALPAVEWVDNHERMRVVLEEVGGLLDARPGAIPARRERVRSLERFGNEIEELAEKLPGEFDVEAIERTHERIGRVREMLERDEAFRRKLMYIGLGSVALLLGIAVWYFDDKSRLASDVETAVHKIAGMREEIAAGRFLELPDFASEWQPRVVQNPQVAGDILAARNALKAQDERRGRLASALSRVEVAMKQVEEADRTDPLESWPTAFADATIAMAEVTDGDLAITDQERADQTRAASAIDRLKRRLLAQADAEVRARVASIGEALDKARIAVGEDRAAAAGQLAQSRADIDTLRTRANDVAIRNASKDYAILRVASPESLRLVAANGPLAKKADELAGMLASRERFDAALGLLDGKLGNWNAYREALQAISRDFSDIAEAADYGRAAEQGPQWIALDEWRAFVGGLPRLPEASAAQAGKIASAFERLSPEAKNLPQADRFGREVMPVITHLAKRDMQGLRADLSEWFRGPWLGELKFVVTSEDGDVYYCLARAEENAERFEAVSGPKRQDGAWQFQTVSKRVTDMRPAPQAALATDLLGMLQPGKTPGGGIAVDEWFVVMIKKVLAAKTVDPILRLLTVRKCLLTAAKHSRAFSEEGKPVLQVIDDGDGGVPGLTLDQLWTFLKPRRQQDPVYLVAKPKAESMLADVEVGLRGIENALRKERGVLEQPIAEVPQVAGRLGRDAEGHLVAVWRDEPPEARDVWWLTTSAALARIGTTGPGGKCPIDKNVAPAGTPLYVFLPTPHGARPSEDNGTLPSNKR